MNERERVLALPMREEDTDALVQKWTGRFAVPGTDWKLRPGQAAALEAIEVQRGGFFPLSVGQGKAHPLDEPVLTPDGFRTIGDLRVGDYVIGSNGHPTRVTGVFEQGVLDVFEVETTDGEKVRACAEHLWTVGNENAHRSGDRSRHVTLTTKQISETLLASGGRRARWHLPLVDPIEFPPRDLPLDPWLLGALLGDGSLCSRSVVFTNGESEIHAAVREALPTPVRAMATSRDIERRLTTPKRDPNPLLEALEDLGLRGTHSHTKFIPPLYLYAPASDRLALLHGLLDTDGTPATARATFSSTSEALAKGVRYLAQSLGGVASIAKRQTYYTYKGERRAGKPSWRVSVKLPPGTPYFLHSAQKKARLKSATKYAQVVRKIVAVRPIGQAQCRCISVEAQDSLYVVSGCVLTHNTLLCMLAGAAAGIPSDEVLYLTKAKLRDEARRELVKYREHFVIPEPEIHSYAELSRVEDLDALMDKPPRMIVCDEAHMLRNGDAARTQLFLRYMRRNPDTIFVAMSGTLTARSLHDYQHLLVLALGDGAPIPKSYPRCATWARCLDERPRNPPRARDWKDMHALISWAGLSDSTETLQTKARMAFGDRMVSTPGVVHSADSSSDVPLALTPVEVEVPEVVWNAMSDANEFWEMPGGEEIEDQLRLASKLRELSQGFYYRWVWPNDEPDREWLNRRAAWASVARTRSGRIGVETDRRFEKLVEAGRARLSSEEMLAWEQWQEVCDRPEPPVEAVWLDDRILRRAVARVKAQPNGILWYSHKAVGERIRELNLLPVSLGGEAVDRSQTHMALSIQAHGTGLNLQTFQYGLVMCPPSSGQTWEQLIGRLHRAGQEKPVEFEVFVHTRELRSAWKQAAKDARYIALTQKISQKIVFALDNEREHA